MQDEHSSDAHTLGRHVQHQDSRHGDKPEKNMNKSSADSGDETDISRTSLRTGNPGVIVDASSVEMTSNTAQEDSHIASRAQDDGERNVLHGAAPDESTAVDGAGDDNGEGGNIGITTIDPASLNASYGSLEDNNNRQLRTGVTEQHAPLTQAQSPRREAWGGTPCLSSSIA